MLLEPVLMFFGDVAFDLASADTASGCLEDPPIKDEDDCKRDVESGARGAYLERDILADDALLLHNHPFDELIVLPSEQWCHSYNQGDCPYQEDHRPNTPHIPVVDVINICNSPVPEK